MEAKKNTYSIKRILYVKVREHVGKYKTTQRLFSTFMIQGLIQRSLYMGNYQFNSGPGRQSRTCLWKGFKNSDVETHVHQGFIE